MILRRIYTAKNNEIDLKFAKGVIDLLFRLILFQI